MDAGRAARAVNLRIMLIAARASDDLRLDFFCECGCFEKVSLTVEQYVSRGAAVLPGHHERSVARP